MCVNRAAVGQHGLGNFNALGTLRFTAGNGQPQADDRIASQLACQQGSVMVSVYNGDAGQRGLSN